MSVDIVLRDYQERAIAEARRLRGTGSRRIVLVSPTGSGKGTIAAYMLASGALKEKRGLFCVHRGEILNDLYDRTTKAGCRSVGIIKGNDSRRNPNALVQIASIDSLRGRTPPPSELVIIDECHRAMGATYQRLFEYYPQATIIGLTATPKRLDGKCLGDSFDEIVIVAQPSELIAAGHILSPQIFTVPEEFLPDTDGLHTRAGDFVAEELEQVVSSTRILGSITDHWAQRAKGLTTFAFAVNRKHGQNMLEMMKGVGIRAVYIDGETKKSERDAALVDLKEGRVEIAISAQIFVEGVDVPRAKCAILARPTQSLTVYLQSVGRVLRPFEGLDAIILDHAGNARRHGLPQEDRDWSLEPQIKPERDPTDGEEDIRIRTCKNCYMVQAASNTTCESCGLPLVGERKIVQEEGTLVEITMAPVEQQKKRFWERQWREAYDKGYDLGFPRARFREKYGENPPSEWVAPERPNRTYTAKEKADFLRTVKIIASRQSYGWDWVKRRYENKFQEPMPASGRTKDDVAETAKASVDPGAAQDAAAAGAAVPAAGSATVSGEF